jgi:hypothetical protein
MGGSKTGSTVRPALTTLGRIRGINMHVNVFDFVQLLGQSTERYLEFVTCSPLSTQVRV